MPLTTTTKMLQDAQSTNTAIGAFNIENMEMAQAVIEGAAEVGCPVILQTSAGTAKYAHVSVFAALVSALAKKTDIPVALHLDHGDEALALLALEAGYTSVMYDGSKETLDENMRRTKAIVQAAAKLNIPVEAELGGVGGKEDDIEGEIDYTDPIQAADFVTETGVSSLAVAIGTAHGVYKTTPRLDIERLIKIRAKVSAPLVLHGASGLGKEDMQKCIKAGICKINFGTDLRIAYTKGLTEFMEQNPGKFDPRAYGKIARDKVKAVVVEKLRVLTNRD